MFSGSPKMVHITLRVWKCGTVRAFAVCGPGAILRMRILKAASLVWKKIGDVMTPSLDFTFLLSQLWQEQRL